MWYNARSPRGSSSDLAASAADLLQPTRRTLILVTGAVCLGSAAVTFPVELGGANLLIVLTVAAATALALWLLQKNTLVSLALWHVEVAAAVAMSAAAFRVPEIAFCFALLPLTAVVTIGWPAGLLAVGLVAGLVWQVHPAWLAAPLPAGYSVAIVAGGAFMGLLGWIVSHSLLTATQWSLFSYEQARESLEEARNNRMELTQSQEDLVQANRELARLSDRLKVMNRVAQEARQTKAEFVANVSHELRTPLNMIIGFSEMITRSPQLYGVELPPALLADIGAIQRNSRHLSDLVDDVLDLSQVEAGRMALSKSRVSVQEIVGAAVETVRALFESKGLGLEAQVSDGIPRLFVDSTRVRQVLINLLSNAGRFTEAGGVVVRAWKDQGKVTISVTDTGPGISLEDLPKLFEPFQQLDGSLRRRHSGSGLGLSISKRFVEMHGGRMWVDSQLGTGTTIAFSLPLDDSPVAVVPADGVRRYSPYRQFEARTRRSKAPAPHVVPRYIVVEEGDTLQRLFQRYLDGTEIVAVSDADIAVSELDSSPAQALVVNANDASQSLSRVDRLFGLPFGTPTIACWIPGLEEAAERLGVVRYLTKPVTPQQLISTLEAIGVGFSGTVLLVDDEAEALQLFTRMLSAPPHNYRIIQAATGQRALRLLRDRQPDVMMLDLVMPGVDGFEVLQRKNQDPRIRDIPVVVVTSRDPSGEPIVSDMLTVSRSGGLSVTDLLACVRALTDVLAPSARSAGQAPPGTPPVSLASG